LQALNFRYGQKEALFPADLDKKTAPSVPFVQFPSGRNEPAWDRIEMQEENRCRHEMVQAGGLQPETIPNAVSGSQGRQPSGIKQHAERTRRAVLK
jgi:hypothetical protein